MSTKQSPAKHPATDANCRLDAQLHKLNMSLRTYKVLKSGFVSTFIIAIALYSIAEGGDPTAIGLAALAALLVVNGFELSEWIAAKEQLQQINNQSPREDE